MRNDPVGRYLVKRIELLERELLRTSQGKNTANANQFERFPRGTADDLRDVLHIVRSPIGRESANWGEVVRLLEKALDIPPF